MPSMLPPTSTSLLCLTLKDQKWKEEQKKQVIGEGERFCGGSEILKRQFSGGGPETPAVKDRWFF